MSDNFMGDYENFVIGEYSGWVNDRDGRMAAILITDQFSRQLFRKQPKAFETDKLALNLALKAMSSEDWANYATFEKLFILMVLMHQENGKYTRMQITEMMKLDREYQEKYPEAYNNGTGKALQMNIKMGQEHDTTIQRYGRYPYRNEVLGRKSTLEELNYLNSAKTYGQ